MQFHGRTVLNPAAFLRQRLPVIALAVALLLAPDARAAETVPPLTTPSPIMGTYGLPQSVTLTCSDGSGSGCAATFYCLGSGCTPTTPYSGPVSIATTSLSFYSTDLDGNSEQVRTYAYTVDPALVYHFERLWPELPQPWYFNQPAGIARDAAGNVYVADKSHNRIQKFDASGAFTVSWGSYGSGNGQLYHPEGIAIGPDGSVYVADTLNSRIQKFTANGNFVAILGSAGSGNGQFNWPRGITVDASGNVYVADSNNHRIQKLTSSGAFLAAWGSSGTGNGQFNTPYGITVDSDGIVYVTDNANHRIQKFDSEGTFIASWGTSGSGNGQFYYPKGITVDANNNIFVVDGSTSHRIQKFTPDGTFVARWGDEVLNSPYYGIVVSLNGTILVTEANNNRIQTFDGSGVFLASWGSRGSANGQLNSPEAVSVAADGNIFLVDTGNNRIQKWAGDGSFLAAWGSYGNASGQFNAPAAIAVEPGGNFYVSDATNFRIQKFSADGSFLTSWGSYGTANGQFSAPHGIALDSAGNVYVVDRQNNRIQKFTSNGTFISTWGGAGSGNGQFNYPCGIAIDAADNVYVADWSNYRVQKFTSGGTFVTSWGTYGTGNGQFKSPEDLTTDPAGNIYVTDYLNHRIQKFSSSGAFVTSWGTYGSGNGQLYHPNGIALDSGGNIYVADTDNNRIQKFNPPPQTPPGAPTGVSAVPGNGQATVYFTAPASNGDSPITSYTVTSSPGNISVSGGSSPITVTGLTNGTGYTFTVTATNTVGTGPASDPSSSVTPAITYLLALTVTGSGTVHSIPAPDINCTSSCGQSYTSGTVVALTATPGSNYSFAGWSGVGGCIGTGSCIVTMSQARSVNALFYPIAIDGACGSAHNNQSVDTPVANLCQTGTPSTVTGIGPWEWTCAGSGGGAAASCSAAQAGGAFYRSSDGGVTWTGRATGIGFNSPINVLAPSPCYNIADLAIYLGAGDGTYRSLDSGDSWTRVLSGDSVQALALSPDFCMDSTLFSGLMLDGVRKSTNGGTTWSTANSGLPSTQVRSLAISPGFTGDQTIFSGILGQGVYKSTNGGTTWSAANAGIDTLTPLALAISPNFAADRTIYAATTDGQYSGGGPHYHIYKSVNGGDSWILTDSGLSGAITRLELSEQFSTDHTLFAVTSSGIYKSTDSGSAWTRINTATAGNSLALSKDYSYDQTLFAGIYGDNVYASTNGGATWTPSTSNFASIRQLSAVAISPVYYFDNTVFATAYFAGPRLSVSPGSLNFSSVKTGTSSTSQQVTISNGMFGDANLAISAITLSGTGTSQYSIAPGSCGSLNPVLVKGAQCAIDVIFNPTADGSASATLQISSNAVMLPTANVTLSGTGVSVASTISSPTTGTVTQGTSIAVSGFATCNGGTVSLVEVSADGGSSWQAAGGTSSWSISLPAAAEGSYSIRSRATTSTGIIETPGTGITVTVDRQAPSGTLALYNGVWTLNANSRDGQMCLMIYPSICGTIEMSSNGVNGWQPATTTPGTGGPLWLRDRAGNVSSMIVGTLSNSNGGPIRMEGGAYYSFLQHALNAAGSGTVLKLSAAQYSETLLANTNASYTVRGGYDSSHNNVTGTSQLSGNLTVQAGTLTVENLDVTGSVNVAGGAVTTNALSIQ